MVVTKTNNKYLTWMTERLVKRLKTKFVVMVGEYEVSIPQPAEGDIFDISKTACEYIAGDIDLLEDDEPFFRDLSRYIDIVVGYKISQDPDAKQEMLEWKNGLIEQATKLMEEYVPSEDDEEDEEEYADGGYYDMEYLQGFVSDDYQNTRGESIPDPSKPCVLEVDKNFLILHFNTPFEFAEETKKWVKDIIVDLCGYVVTDMQVEKVEYKFMDFEPAEMTKLIVELDAEYDE